MQEDVTNPKFFSGKKVLVFGLGLLGGGVATTNWLLKQGADVTITDLKDEKQLSISLKQIKGSVKLNLGGHKEEDIFDNEIIVINPDISIRNPYVELAIKLGKQVENEATLFYQLCGSPIIAVTGTRGKTTTTSWIRHFLDLRYTAVIAGNLPAHPLLKMLNQINRLHSTNVKSIDGLSKPTLVVNELPSFHLELFSHLPKAPDVAVITNLYRDHLNRHLSLEDYANTKANIFLNQKDNQHLILNYNNEWTPFFLSKRPSSKVWFFSITALPIDAQGVYYSKGIIYLQNNDQTTEALKVHDFSIEYGEHNLENLLVSSLAAWLYKVPWPEIQSKLSNLPQTPFRQETVFQNERIRIINDTTATTPEGCVAAIKRFGSPNCILISGGTDAKLEYGNWARILPDYINLENVILLAGSATNKMLNALGCKANKVRVLNTLRDCVDAGMALASSYPRSVLLFSPGAKSFEKFKNEVDRGKQFNKLIKRKSQKWMTH